jgi:hypothetical protein
MTDRVNEGEADDKAKRSSGLNNSILGGFARTSAKRFAEYKYSAKENEARATVATAAPSNRHNRREWLERLFDLFEQYAVEVNKLVDEPHLVTTCRRPTEQPSDNPLVTPNQGVVATKYWQMTVRLQSDGIAGFILPMSMEKTFLRDESLFERIFLIESLGDENAAVWSFDSKPTEFFQLPDLAKRFFGSLIEIAQMEDMSNFENATPGEATPPTALAAPAVEAQESDADEPLFDDEAMFKDLLNFGSTVLPTPALDNGGQNAAEAQSQVSTSPEVSDAVASNSPFAQLSAEPVIDLAKLDAQAESMRKKNKSNSSDFATKTLDSYALLDFEDEATYYSEYRLTASSEHEPANGGNGLFTPVADEKPAESGLSLPAKPSRPQTSSMQSLAAVESPFVEAPVPESSVMESTAAELTEAVEDKPVEPAAIDVHHESPVNWESGSPVAWQHTEAAPSADLQAHAESGAEASMEAGIEAGAAEKSEPSAEAVDEPQFLWLPSQESSAETEAAAAPEAASPPSEAIAHALPKISPVTVDPSVLAEEPAEVESITPYEPSTAAAPVITPVTAVSNSAQASVQSQSESESEGDAPHTVPHREFHGYRSNDLDLLTPEDVDMTPPVTDVHQDDDEIAQALLKVTELVPEINETLSRNELNSEVQKLAAKLQQSSNDFIGAFNRKASELSGEHQVFEESSAPHAHAESAADDGAQATVADSSSGEVSAVVHTPLEESSAEDAESSVEDDVDFDEFELAMREGVFAETSVAAQAIEQVIEHQAPESQAVQQELHQEAEQEMHSETTEAEVVAHSHVEAVTPILVVEELLVETVPEPELEPNVAVVEEPPPAEAMAEPVESHDSAVIQAEVPADEEFFTDSLVEPTITAVAAEPLGLVEDVSELVVEVEATVEEVLVDPVVEPVAEVVEVGEVADLASAADAAKSVVSHEVPAEADKQPLSDRFKRNNQSQAKSFQPYSVAASAESPVTSQDSGDSPKTFFESLQTITARKSNSQITALDTAQPQENSMPKTEEMSVVAAIEMMKHSVDQELVALAEHGARAFQDQDMDAVEKAMKRTRRVQEFKDLLLPALSTWDALGKDD